MRQSVFVVGLALAALLAGTGAAGAEGEEPSNAGRRMDLFVDFRGQFESLALVDHPEGLVPGLEAPVFAWYRLRFSPSEAGDVSCGLYLFPSEARIVMEPLDAGSFEGDVEATLRALGEYLMYGDSELDIAPIEGHTQIAARALLDFAFSSLRRVEERGWTRATEDTVAEMSEVGGLILMANPDTKNIPSQDSDGWFVSASSGRSTEWERARLARELTLVVPWAVGAGHLFSQNAASNSVLLLAEGSEDSACGSGMEEALSRALLLPLLLGSDNWKLARLGDSEVFVLNPFGSAFGPQS